MARYISDEHKNIGKTGAKEVIGMPDDWDKRNIQNLIKNYHRKYPSNIPTAIKHGRELSGYDTRAKLKDNVVLGRHVLELPADLANEIELAYPTMFRDKDHLAWFKKNFQSLLL